MVENGVTEIVRVFAKEGRGEAFVESLRSAVNFLTQDDNCLGVKVYRGVENPDDLMLVIRWTSIDDHNAWRESEPRMAWREQIAPFQAKPNEMAHFDLTIDAP